VLTRDSLATAASGRIEEALGAIAGFQEFRRSDSRSANPSAQGATLRALGGNAASRTLVLLDGVPMGDPMFGSVPFSAIAPDRLAAVAVSRGGGSGAWGAGAVAGTIAMQSANADQLGLFSGEALGDDRGETALSASLAPHVGEGFIVASARWDRGEGFWTTPASQRVPASVRAAYDSWSTALRGVMPVAPDIELQARGLVFDDHRTLRFAGANSTSSGEDASVRLVGRGPWQFDAIGYAQWRGFSNVVISSSTYRETLDQRRTPSNGLGGKLELRPPVGAGQVLRLGIDGRDTRGDLWEDSYSGATGALTGHRQAGGRNADLGLFAEDDWTLGRLVLTGGARADYWSIASGHITTTTPAGVATTTTYADRAGWAPSGRAGAVWHAGGGLALRASAYTGQRQPTLNELYRTYVVFPVTITANPALRPERLEGYEGGLDITPLPGLHLSATAFYNRVAHAIANVTIGTNLQQRENVRAIRARGLEFGGDLTRGTLSLDASLALTSAVVEAPGAAINGLRPAQTPKIAASAGASWRPHLLGREGWLVSASLRHTGAQFEDDLSSYVLPAATTIGAVVEVPLRPGVALVLRGENLGDATVETRNQAGSIDLGVPRTLWLGLRIGGR
jgi:outer membrane receptor protein involved in Fe transport